MTKFLNIFYDFLGYLKNCQYLCSMKTYSNYNRVYLSMPISGYDLDERAEFANEMTDKVKLAFPNAEVIDPITLSSALNDKHKENGLEPPTYKEYLDKTY